jgi:hypothetical protein
VVVKAVALVTAAVLIVIGIGVGLVGGLTYPLPAARTYEVANVSFSVAFPGQLVPVNLSSGPLFPEVGKAGLADDGHLELVVQDWGQGSGFVVTYAPRFPCFAWSSRADVGLPFRLNPGEVCSASVVPDVPGGSMFVEVYSTEGLQPAQEVARSLRVLGSGDSS